MRWISILIAAYIISKNVLVYGVFLQVFVEVIEFEANSHGLFGFGKNDSASRHSLKIKSVFNNSLPFCVGITLLQNFVYGLQPTDLQLV